MNQIDSTNGEFKIRVGGMRIRVRIQQAHERITEKSLRCDNSEVTQDTAGRWRWYSSAAVGDLVGDHPDFTYIEVLSPWFTTGSCRSDFFI